MALQLAVRYATKSGKMSLAQKITDELIEQKKNKRRNKKKFNDRHHHHRHLFLFQHHRVFPFDIRRAQEK